VEFMESIIVQHPYVERIRKKYFSLFTVCIMDIERKPTASDVDLFPGPPFYHNDKDRPSGTSYSIDLKI